MKKIQRNFVVEYKTARRQSRHANASIWGDANLKELLAIAEEHVPTVPVVERMDPPPPGPENLARAVEPNDGRDPTTVAISPVAATGDADRASPAVPVQPPASNMAGGSSPPVTSPERAGVKRKKMREPASRANHFGSQGRLSVKNAPIELMTDGVLEELEAENRRLKNLLAQQLRKQNRTLSAMLARAESRRLA